MISCLRIPKMQCYCFLMKIYASLDATYTVKVEFALTCILFLIALRQCFKLMFHLKSMFSNKKACSYVFQLEEFCKHKFWLLTHQFNVHITEIINGISSNPQKQLCLHVRTIHLFTGKIFFQDSQPTVGIAFRWMKNDFN